MPNTRHNERIPTTRTKHSKQQRKPKSSKELQQLHTIQPNTRTNNKPHILQQKISIQEKTKKAAKENEIRLNLY